MGTDSEYRTEKALVPISSQRIPKASALPSAMASEGRARTIRVRFKRTDMKLTEEKCDVSLETPVSQPMRGVLQSYGIWEYEHLNAGEGSVREQTRQETEEQVAISEETSSGFVGTTSKSSALGESQAGLSEGRTSPGDKSGLEEGSRSGEEAIVTERRH